MSYFKAAIVLLLSVGILGQSNDLNKINYVCVDCVKLVNAALSFMSDKPVQDYVVNMLDSEVCGRLNYVFMKDCTDQVEGVVPYFMMYLQDHIPRLTSCQALNLCPYTPYSTSTPIPKETKQFITSTIRDFIATVSGKPMPGPAPTPAPPSAECEYCQLAEGEIQMLLENQQAKAIVKQYLGVVCDELPFNSVECTNLLALYVDQVFHIIQGYLGDDELCVELEMCPKAADTVTALVE